VSTVATPGVEPGPLEGAVAIGAVWEALRDVPDPEIPVVSIVELGIVRSVAMSGGKLTVRVTPTYSGCPATAMIDEGIRAALQKLRIAEFSIETVLAPPWTTDWIAPEAKAKLRAFGIAPAGAAAPRVDVAGISPLRSKVDVRCPRCGSTSTSLIAQFGSTACKALYRCRACEEPFDYFKPF
jgi:ring-1,2-phenylacetyl-CoA epoxidase subunit PaaD